MCKNYRNCLYVSFRQKNIFIQIITYIIKKFRAIILTIFRSQNCCVNYKSETLKRGIDNPHGWFYNWKDYYNPTVLTEIDR